ncbi:hypothetical protein BJ322DRAFT_1081658 [Thelephora terrestris]|uniref:SnoaL-like domain-containing protein n=1 Tax=Thelephora terrestris TaxID=56493 RepID=A0A9P6H9W5_9AGAM|nr:hypothetical protein BJ322DRAFT_1081658 [Thelephora terrestris]
MASASLRNFPPFLCSSPQMCDLHNSKSPQVKLMFEWGRGFETRDITILEKHLHKDFRHVTYPRSLALPEQTKEGWIAQMKGVISLWTEDCKATIHSVIEAPGKVVIHITSTPKNSLGLDASHEAITIAHIVTDEDGTLKIKTLEDFVDSKSHLDFMQALVAASANK